MLNNKLYNINRISTLLRSTYLQSIEYVEITQAITYLSLTLVTYVLNVIMLKSLKLSLIISVTLVLFICYFTKEAHNGKF